MSGYIGNIPTPQATQTRETFTATASQTTFNTAGYTPGFVDVWLNGVKLVNGDDFTATNGSDVVLTVGAASGDTVEVLSFSTFEVNSQTFTGGLTVNNDGATVITADRATSDGSIVDFKKGGTTVGSIGTWSGISYIGSGDAGLAFAYGNDDIRPFNPSTVSQRDAAISLGESGTRFKDLYLSGGVYLGGTGAANYLDDYETGTWTASSAQLTITSQDCVYEKVGNLVHVSGYIVVSASSSSVISISNLIFSAAENSSLSVGVGGKTTSFERIDDGGSIATFGIDSNITSSTEIYFSASYRTS